MKNMDGILIDYCEQCGQHGEEFRMGDGDIGDDGWVLCTDCYEQFRTHYMDQRREEALIDGDYED